MTEVLDPQMEAMMEFARPKPEHAWLQRLVGEWTYESEGVMEPGGTSHRHSGTETVRAIGDIWIQGEGTCPMPDGSDGTTLITLGYDPAREKFVGSWAGAMMPNLWVYEGSLDQEQRVLTLESEGPSFSGDGSTSRYRDVVEIVSDDERLLKGQVLGDNGEWFQFMTSRYRRK
jgi:hypothetical protein